MRPGKRNSMQYLYDRYLLTKQLSWLRKYTEQKKKKKKYPLLVLQPFLNLNLHFKLDWYIYIIHVNCRLWIKLKFSWLLERDSACDPFIKKHKSSCYENIDKISSFICNQGLYLIIDRKTQRFPQFMRNKLSVLLETRGGGGGASLKLCCDLKIYEKRF